MKKTFRLKESELRRMISESVRRVLNENSYENNDKEIIIDVLTAFDSHSQIVSLQLLERKYQMLRRILNKDVFENNYKILEPYLKDIITIELNGTLYGAFDVYLENQNIYVEFGSMRKIDSANYVFDSEFDIDEVSISLEKFRQINEQEYEKLVKRFKNVQYDMDTKHIKY